MGSSIKKPFLFLAFAVSFASVPSRLASQAVVEPSEIGNSALTTIPEQPAQTYVRPSEGTRVHNYIFDTFGPYPIAGSAFTAGINQLTDSPPEWHQGLAGYSKRLGSDFGIAAVGTTARYGLAQALREDTIYYRCDCSGFFPRLRHAVISTLTARHGVNGDTVFSVPDLVAPYAGTFAAVYGWYPSRYRAMDALRMGNYDLLADVGGNIALEFLYSGPHSLLSKLHLNNPQDATNSGPSH